jgi:hypothetical protein
MHPRRIRALPRTCGPALLALCLLGLAGAASADAAPGPHWSIAGQPEPSYFRAGDGSDAYRLIVRNDGALPTVRGSAVSVSDALPAGVVASKVTASGGAANGEGSPSYPMACPEGPVTGVLTCTYQEDSLHGTVLPGATFVLTIAVSGVGPGDEPNRATVSGGGAPSVSTSFEAGSAQFGLAYFTTDIAGEGGEADRQAGSHPYELTASLAFSVSAREPPGTAEAPLADAAPKDIEVALPPGLVGDPNAVPKCSQQAFQAGVDLNCPVDTQLGTIRPFFYGAFHSADYPVFNIAPPPGQPAELGFTIAGIGHVPMFFHVRRSGNDYALTVSLNDIPEAGPLQGAILTLWGVPAAGSHDLEREGTFGLGSQEGAEFCKPEVKVEEGAEHDKRCPSGVAAKPFLTLPGRCEGTLPVGVFTDSWQRPSEEQGSYTPESEIPSLSGCEQLSFGPSIAVVPETTQAGAPSGYTVDVHAAQEEDPTALATADLRRAVLTLPPGTVISPAVGDGLQGCSRDEFALQSTDAASCPAASQIGTVQLTTPLLSSPLEGEAFLAQPECAPCTPSDAREGRMIRLLLQARGSGVTIKLEGSVSVDQDTGQLTVTFDEAPQLPLEELKLSLEGGSRAPLANPRTCGIPLATLAQFTPYGGQAPAQQSSAPYELGGCSAPQFVPTLIAGTTSNQAGAFSPLAVTLARTDQQQELEAITVRTPPGLIATLSRVTPCPAAQVIAHACGPQSRLGTASVGLGPGPDPLFVGGQVYLTGPHDGAPFGLSIVVAAIAGPFDLGTLDVGASVSVDPSTAALMITTDQLPRSLDGIPLQIKAVSLELDRAGFILNPTSCNPMAITGTLRSEQGSLAAVSSRFQAAGCARLAFKPKLTALTHAWTSKTLGAYLHVKLVSGAGQANIAKLKLDLPKQLPARLSTLRKACLASVFSANPAVCPAGSLVGTATAATPIFGNPLRGPVYLVSHGGAAAPVLEIVLQGEGVTLRLDGQASVRDGIAASSFRSLPDVPISTFDLVLDEGAHSALGANLPRGAGRSMCGQSLVMPVAITAQNGAVIKQTTKIAVSGCPRKHKRAHGRERQPAHRHVANRAPAGA